MNKEQTWALIRGALRSTAASVPGLASLAQAWSEYENRLQSKRVALLLNEFSDLAKRNEERLRAVEDHIRESGEFSQLVEESVERSSREANERKIAGYARLLVNLLAAGKALTLDQKLADYAPRDWRGAVEAQKYELLPSGERLRQLLGIEAHDATIRRAILWPDGYTG